MNNSNSYSEVESQDDSEKLQVVAFNLGKEEYAINILNVQEIIRILNITRVPRADYFVEGVMNLRGNIIPVLNLHKKFGIDHYGNIEDRRIIVFKVDDVTAGVIVDKVSEVLHVNKADIEEANRLYSSLDTRLIKGIIKVGERLLILMEIDKLLEDETEV